MITLEQQVCNLQLSQRLKELRVAQERLFEWAGDYVVASGTGDGISAFTVAELGTILPFKIVIGDAMLWLQIAKYELCWTAEYTRVAGTLMNPRAMDAPIKTTADTFANCLAKMLMYLLENKLVTL